MVPSDGLDLMESKETSNFAGISFSYLVHIFIVLNHFYSVTE